MSSPSTTPRFRFSLRWLLLAVAIVAVIFGVFSISVGQSLVAWLLMVLLRGVLPSIALVGAVFTRGNWRAFSLGALVACLPLLTGQSGAVYSLTAMIWVLGSQAIYILVCGGVAVAARGWLVRRGITNDL